jgi:hypothetical protein
LNEWLTTFNTFSDYRAEAGVNSVAVRHAVDDPNLVTVDLEFDTADQARSFLGRLETEIWPNSPHFSGTPTTQLLESVGASV